jgi:hypothetical protein
MADTRKITANAQHLLSPPTDNAEAGNGGAARSRRQVLGQGALVAGVVAAAGSLPVSARAADKMPKAQAGYKDSSAGEKECDRCAQFQPPSACKIVDGAISPSGSCNYFTAKPA